MFVNSAGVSGPAATSMVERVEVLVPTTTQLVKVEGPDGATGGSVEVPDLWNGRPVTLKITGSGRLASNEDAMSDEFSEQFTIRMWPSSGDAPRHDVNTAQMVSSSEPSAADIGSIRAWASRGSS